MSATSRCRPEDGGAARAPKFFKIITDPVTNKLRIPDEFMRRYGQNLQKSVFLKVPRGSSWKVELMQSKCDTWLHHGWQEFRDYYCITIGHFLLFDYRGNSKFDVLIFDPTASEIDYPFAANPEKVININSTTTRVLQTEDAESESDDSVVFLERIVTSKNGLDKGKGKDLEKVQKYGPSGKKRSKSGDSDPTGKKPAREMRKFSHDSKQESRSKACSSNIHSSKRDLKSAFGPDSKKVKGMIKRQRTRRHWSANADCG